MKKVSKLALILWAVAALFFLVSFSFIASGKIGEFITGVAIAAVLAFIGWKKSKPQEVAKPAQVVEQTQACESTTDDGYEYKTFKVAGVTFKNGRKSRQTILRKIKWRDEEFADGVTLTIKEETFQGGSAVGIYANDQQIGNAPADLAGWIVENWDRIISVSNLEVVGGGNSPSGEALSFGARVTIKLSKQLIK